MKNALRETTERYAMNKPVPRALLSYSGAPVSLEEMHDLTDVFMAGIHHAYSGQKVDGRALAGAFVAAAVGVLRDLGEPEPKRRVKEFVDALDMADIAPFTPTRAD